MYSFRNGERKAVFFAFTASYAASIKTIYFDDSYRLGKKGRKKNNTCRKEKSIFSYVYLFTKGEFPLHYKMCFTLGVAKISTKRSMFSFCYRFLHSISLYQKVQNFVVCRNDIPTLFSLLLRNAIARHFVFWNFIFHHRFFTSFFSHCTDGIDWYLVDSFSSWFEVLPAKNADVLSFRPN